LDLVLAEVEAPPPDAAWDEAIRAGAISVHDAFKRHTWAPPLLISPAHIPPARLLQLNGLLEILRDAGFSADATYHAYHVLDGYITGFSLWERSHSFTPIDMTNLAALVDELLPVELYPAMNEHAQQHMTEGPHRSVIAFEFGLDLILEGLREARRR